MSHSSNSPKNRVLTTSLLALVLAGASLVSTTTAAKPQQSPATRLLHAIERPTTLGTFGGYAFAYLESIGLQIRLRPRPRVDASLVWPRYDPQKLELSVWPIAGSPSELRARLERFVAGVTGHSLAKVAPLTDAELGTVYRTHALFWLLRGLIEHTMTLGTIRQSCGDFVAEETSNQLAVVAFRQLGTRSPALARHVQRYLRFLDAVGQRLPSSTKQARWLEEVAIWTFNGKAIGPLRRRALVFRDLLRSLARTSGWPKKPFAALFFEPSRVLRADKPGSAEIRRLLADRFTVRRCAGTAALYRHFDERFIPQLAQLVSHDPSHSVRLLAFATLLKHPREQSRGALDGCRSTLFLPLLPKCRNILKKLDRDKKDHKRP